MTSFIFIATLITIVVLALLIMPLVRTRNTQSYERQAQNIHYAKERLEELELQLENASITATDYEALKLEIETTLAHDIDLDTQNNSSKIVAPKRSNKVSISLLSICLPIVAIGFYLVAGTPEALSPELAEQRSSSKAEDIQLLVQNMEEKLAENPDNIQGWGLLSRTYLQLRQYAKAREGFLRVIELGGATAPNYASLADATILLARGQVTNEASDYLNSALQLDSNNEQALWLAGLGAMQKGDKATARTHWERLLGRLSNLPEQQENLRIIIAENLGQTPAKSPVATSKTSIKVTVAIAPEVLSLAKPEDLVFVFAKAQSGPPAPLAVKRLSVADLPATLELTDADAMMSQLTISKFEDLVVSARISKSGQPVAQSGDIESEPVATQNTSTEELQISINKIVN